MNKELAKTLTTALVQFIDRERPEGTMCCSNAECVNLETAFCAENFGYIEAFIQRKLSGLTEFEQGFLERVFHQKPEDLNDVTKEIFLEDARFVFNLAREQLIKDGYVIEKKAFHDAVEKVDPEVMKEVSENVDKPNEEKPIEFEKFMDKVVDDAIRETYSKDGFYDICRDALALAKKEILKNLPKWKTIKKDDNAIKEYPHVGTNMLGEKMLYIGENAISISYLEKLPGFNN